LNKDGKNYQSIFWYVFKLILIILVFNFIASIIFFNSIHSYIFLKNQEGVFYSLYKEIDKIDKINVNASAFKDVIKEVQMNNCIIEIYDTNNNTRIYSPYVYESNIFAVNNSKEIFDSIIGNENDIFLMLDEESLKSQKYKYINNLNNQNNQYSMIIRHNDGIYVLVQTSNKHIQNNKELLYKSLLLCFLYTSIIGIIPAYLMSKKMLLNIQSIKNVTKKIIDRDFSEKCKANIFNEFHELSGNINEMSDVIHSQIEEIEKKNEILRKDIEIKEQQEQIQKDFVSNVSHELKTPISIISGYTEGIKYELVTEKEDIIEYCDTIINECNRMTKIVKQLLDLSLLENSNNLNIECHNISEMARIIVAKYHVKNSDRKIVVDIEDNLNGYCDYNEIENVLINYIDNAIKYSSDEIKITVKDDNDYIHVGVVNKGTLSEQEKENVWNRFYRTDKSHKRNENSSGLGLSIVKATMNKHNMPYGVDVYSGNVEFYIKIIKNI